MSKETRGAEEPTFAHRIELWLFLGVMAVMKMLGLDRASWLLGKIGRTIGPMLPATRTARRNLVAAFPDKSPGEVRRIIADMWENFARTAAELPFLAELSPYRPNSRVEVIGREHIEQIGASASCGIFFSGHFANWELMSACISHLGYPLTGVYRSLNNSYIDTWLREKRGKHIYSDLAPKGSGAAKPIFRAVRRGGNIAILVDQKTREGVLVPFFGRMAKTPPFPGELFVRFDCPLVPVHIVRLKGAHFRATFYPPLEIPRTGDDAADRLAVLTACNAFLEERIREHPSQWLWLHNRWTKSKRAKARAKARKKRQTEAASSSATH